MPMDDDRGRGQTQSSPSGMGAGRAAERGDTTGYQGQGRGSGVTSDRPSPGGGNTGGSDRDRRKAADDAGAKATQDAVDRDKKKETQFAVRPDLQEVAAREYQARLVAAAAQAEETRRQTAESNKNLGISSLMAMGSGNVMNPTPVSPMSGQGTIGSRPVNDPTRPTTALDRFYSGEMGYKAPPVGIENVSSGHREKMIRAVIGEAANQGPIGMQAAAFSMTNRLQAGNYGSTIGDVVTSPGQYSAFNEGNPAGSYAYSVSEDSPTYKAAAAAVDAVLSGSVRDPTFGAVNYANVAEVNRTYTQDEINRGQAPSQASRDRVNAESADPSAIRIGAHTFTNNSAISGPGVSGTQPRAVAVRSFLDKAYDNVKAVVETVADATGVTSAVDFLTNKSLRDEIVRDNNRDRQMTSEEVNIAMFNRLHPEAGSNKELYGGRDRTPLPTQVAAATTPPAVVPPVVPTEPVMPTVPNFATAQKYTGTPTVATTGFDFSRPFAPRPPMDFANLGPAYAPTALPSAPPSQPLPGIPGAAYATPYQRLG